MAAQDTANSKMGGIKEDDCTIFPDDIVSEIVNVLRAINTAANNPDVNITQLCHTLLKGDLKPFILDNHLFLLQCVDGHDRLFAPATNGTGEPRVVVPLSGVQDTLVKLFNACLADVANRSNPAVLAEEFRSRVQQGYVGIPTKTVDEFLKSAFNSNSGAQVQPMRPIPMAPNQGMNGNGDAYRHATDPVNDGFMRLGMQGGEYGHRTMGGVINGRTKHQVSPRQENQPEDALGNNQMADSVGTTQTPPLQSSNGRRHNREAFEEPPHKKSVDSMVAIKRDPKSRQIKKRSKKPRSVVPQAQRGDGSRATREVPLPFTEEVGTTTKKLTNSDTNSIGGGRILVNKTFAEKYLPHLEKDDIVQIEITHRKDPNRKFKIDYRFWPNRDSRVYVMERTKEILHSFQAKNGSEWKLFAEKGKLYFDIV